jgi:NADH:ubiquinone oxidoreductase subunit 6 (subunit J)
MKLRPFFLSKESKWSWNKLASERGRRDGKSEKPTIEWGPNSVPFLIELYKRAMERAKILQSDTRTNLGNAVRQAVSRDDRLIFLKSQISFQNSKAEGTVIRAGKIQAQIDGYVEENPVGRFARLRAIPDVVYFPVLFILAAGEVLITAPALIDLFNDNENIAYIIAGAVGILTIVFAHILGISLKMKLDRHRPQEGWVIKLLIPLSLTVAFAVIILAILRTSQTFDKLANFNVITSDIGKKLFLFFFFLIIQLSFIGIAAMLAFLHHSQLEHDLKSAKRELKYLEKAQKKLVDEYSSIASQSFLSEDTIRVAREELVARVEVIESNYAAAAAIYCDSNIHARRDAIDAAHISMIPPKFDFTVDSFEDLIRLSSNYGSSTEAITRD